MGYGSLMHLIPPKEHQRCIHWIFLVLLIVSSIKQLFTSEYIGDQQWIYIPDLVAALCILKCARGNQSAGTMYWSLQPFFNLQHWQRKYKESGEYLNYCFLWIMWYFAQILVYNCCTLWDITIVIPKYYWIASIICTSALYG
jgi:hypothetical protein